jgi:hypothetical protein
MSSSTLGHTSTSSENFKSILDAALNRALGDYKDKTGKALLDDPFAIEVQRCHSVDAIKAIFQGQAEALQQIRDGDDKLVNRIGLVVNILHTFSNALGLIAGIVRPRNPLRDNSKYILTLFLRRSPMQRSSLVGSVSFLLSVYSPQPFVNSS